MNNEEVAARLLEIADLLDVLGERFKPEAYRRAARSIETLTEGVEAVAARGGLREVPGVGDAIEEKVGELLRTGEISYLVRLRREVPAGLRELMRLPGLGPKTARRFWTDFGIEGPAELASALDAGRLNGVKGFGEKKIAQLRAVVQSPTAGTGAAARLPLEVAYPLAQALLAGLKSGHETDEVAIAGSFRRGRETVGDLDILATSNTPEKVFDRFSGLPEVGSVRLRGPTKETVVLKGGLQVDLRVVEPEAFGAALQYFTGSKDHNVRLRSLARDQGLKINEYGVFRGEERVGGRTEEEVYRLLGLAWIPPELREDRGEIALAQAGTIPRLVEQPDLRGDLHVHLDPPAGPAELMAVIEEAQRRSLDYLGVVVAGRDEHGRPWTVPERTLARFASADEGPVRLVAMVEHGGSEPAPEVPALPLQGVVVRADGSAPSKEPGGRPAGPFAIVAHLSGDEKRGDRALELARAFSAAVEVGPGAGRADSSLARAALGQGRRLSLPTGLGEKDVGATAAVALAFARRASAGREEILNGGPLSRVTGAGPKRRH